jgi:antitoxin component of MazEF toxin-antitoxin module
MPTTYSINGTEGKGGALRMTIPLEVRQKLDIHKDDQVDIQVVGDVMEVRKHSREPAAPAVNREAPAANTVVVPTVPEVCQSMAGSGMRRTRRNCLKRK